MRFVHHFCESIDVNSVNNLMAVIHQYEAIDLFFETDGGYVGPMETLIHALNSHGDINIYLTGGLLSCGTDILLDFEGPIFITINFDLMMFHQTDRTIGHIRDKGHVDKLFASIHTINERKLKRLKKEFSFTRRELKVIEDGDDLFWYPKDFKRLLVKKNIKFT